MRKMMIIGGIYKYKRLMHTGKSGNRCIIKIE